MKSGITSGRPENWPRSRRPSPSQNGIWSLLPEMHRFSFYLEITVAIFFVIFFCAGNVKNVFSQQTSQAQQLATLKASASPPKSELSASSKSLLASWRNRQKRVSAALKKVGPAVISINDGESWGSGVVVSRDGIILTAGHVILDEDSEYSVFFPNGKQFKAKPLGKNLNIDAGMMKIIDKGDYPFVDMANGKRPARGSWCIALGHAGGFDIGRRPPVRLGKILRPEYNAYITDCAIIGGDSGGPLFDLDGSLIGIHSSIGDTIAQNRHVRIAKYLQYWDRLQSGESWGRLPGSDEDDQSESMPAPRSKSPALGVEVQKTDNRAIVRGISAGSAAQRVGIQVNDVIIEFGNVRIFSPDALIREIGKKRVGDQVKIKILRGKTTIHLDVILGAL